MRISLAALRTHFADGILFGRFNGGRGLLTRRDECSTPSMRVCWPLGTEEEENYASPRPIG
jgi:hypothetical protein